jgi:glutathione synthase/RimK-type ligase-like ATP-grasp enzyme
MNYFPRVRSKNHSLDALRRSNRGLPALPVKSVVRFGSTTPTSEVFKNKTTVKIVEINTVEAVRISSNKLLMKEAFRKAEVKQPEWYTVKGETVFKDSEPVQLSSLPYPLIYKQIYGSRGKGMRMINNQKELEELLKSSTAGNYLEKYYNYVREYRLHCTEKGCFYACRKMLKEDAEARWFRNDSNCVWYVDTNVKFDKPTNWKVIEDQCVRALKATGLDFGAFDVRVQSSKNRDGSTRKEPEFVIIEVNSAPSFGELTELKYKEILPQLIKDKANA